jgi:hypothetical protein
MVEFISACNALILLCSYLDDNLFEAFPDGIFANVGNLTNLYDFKPRAVYERIHCILRSNLEGNLFAAIPANLFTGLTQLSTL